MASNGNLYGIAVKSACACENGCIVKCCGYICLLRGFRKSNRNCNRLLNELALTNGNHDV